MKDNATNYERALLPVIMSGNVYTKGANQDTKEQHWDWNVNLANSVKKLLKDKQVSGELDQQNFDAAAKIVKEKDGIYLEINMDKNWLAEQKRKDNW